MIDVKCPNCGNMLTPPEMSLGQNCPTCRQELTAAATAASTGREIGPAWKSTFQPSLENVVAGIIIGMLMIGGGSASAYFATKGVIDSGGNLPVYVEKGWCWIAVGLAWLLGILLVAGGASFINDMRMLAAIRCVTVNWEGLSVIRQSGSQLFAWDDILSVTETHVYTRLPILSGPANLIVPKSRNCRFLIKRKDGEEFSFFPDRIRDHERLVSMLKGAAERQGVPWETVEEHV